jgi:hypothetical protein
LRKICVRRPAPCRSAKSTSSAITTGPRSDSASNEPPDFVATIRASARLNAGPTARQSLPRQGPMPGSKGLENRAQLGLLRRAHIGGPLDTWCLTTVHLAHCIEIRVFKSTYMPSTFLPPIELNACHGISCISSPNRRGTARLRGSLARSAARIAQAVPRGPIAAAARSCACG